MSKFTSALAEQPKRPRILSSLWDTGRQTIGWMYGQSMSYPTQVLIRDGIQALQADADWRWWRGEYERDYGLFHRIGGGEILRLRELEGGRMCPRWIQHISITTKCSAILHPDGTCLRLSHLRDLGPGTRVADYVSWSWVRGRTLRFRPTLPFPLTNAQATCFRLLCDTLVANFPSMTSQPDDDGLIRPYNIPTNVDVQWFLRSGMLTRFEHGLPVDSVPVLSQRELQRTPTIMIDSHMLTPAFECDPCLTRLVLPWRGTTPWEPKRRHIKMALNRKSYQAGLTARAARMERWREADKDIAASLATVPWEELQGGAGLTAYDRQLWLRLAHHQLYVHGTREDRPGCTRSGCTAEQPVGPCHLVWECADARDLWMRIAKLWGARDMEPTAIKKAVFSRSPPRTVYDWRARIKERDLVITDRLEHWLKNLWLQLITCGLRRLWAKSVATALGEKDERAVADYHAVTHHWAQAVRGTILTVAATASATRDLDIRLLRILLRGLQDPDELPTRLSTAETAYLLFFDGGSRGNPGPGGSGSVIVRLGTQPDIVWAGAMSYAQASTTNNIAEYHGLCTGLKVAEQHGWTPLEVVGDSMLIIRQMSRRQRPKANSLRPLYEQARTTADALRVRGWHHHYRSHNKMADKAAN